MFGKLQALQYCWIVKFPGRRVGWRALDAQGRSPSAFSHFILLPGPVREAVHSGVESSSNGGCYRVNAQKVLDDTMTVFMRRGN